MSTATAPATKPAAKEDSVDLNAIVQATESRLMQRPELLQMRMENETIMTDCRKHPRDMAKIRQALADLLQSFPEFAEDAVYCKPCGKDDAGNQVYAEGLSIRAAEALAEMYGANRVRGDVTMIDENHVKIDANFTDYERGRIWQDGAICSKIYRGKNGQMRSHSDDRFLNVVIKAEKSKLIREVICRSVNAALKAWFQNECKKIAARTIGAEDIKSILDYWKTMGVGREQLETFVGKPITMGWTQQDKIKLRQVAVAIKEGETSVAEVFSPKPPETTPSKSLDEIADAAEAKKPKPKGKAKDAPALDPPHVEPDNDDLANMPPAAWPG